MLAQLVVQAAKVEVHRNKCIKTQSHSSALHVGGKYLFSLTKEAVVRCVGALWPPLLCFNMAWVQRDQLWSGGRQSGVMLDSRSLYFRANLKSS